LSHHLPDDLGELPEHLMSKGETALDGAGQQLHEKLKSCAQLTREAAEAGVDGFIAYVSANCPSTVTRVLVGYNLSDYGAMVHLVALSRMIDLPSLEFAARRRLDDPPPNEPPTFLRQPPPLTPQEEHEVLLEAEQVLNTEFNELHGLGFSVHLSGDVSKKNPQELLKHVVKSACGESVTFVTEVSLI
jgi:hypothetical protein